MLNMNKVVHAAIKLENEERRLCAGYMANNPEDHERERYRDALIEGIIRMYQELKKMDKEEQE